MSRQAVDVGDAEDQRLARLVPGSGSTPMGMFRPSAKVVILRARPSGPKSSRTLTVSRGLVAVLGGEGVLDGVGDPEPALVVEGEVHRLVDVRLGGDELDLEAGRQAELLDLVGGRRAAWSRRRWALAGRGRGSGKRRRGWRTGELCAWDRGGGWKEKGRRFGKAVV